MRAAATEILKGGAAAALVAVAVLGSSAVSTARALPLYMSLGEQTTAPDGWIFFCIEYKSECKTTPLTAQQVTLSKQGWNELDGVNRWVNSHIRPLSDMEHWGVLDRWNYPDDGYGDCEDYALLKRRMLMQAGWPRQALLITVVHDLQGEGHAVLTVKTDKGEFILDNQRNDILLWSDTGYEYLSRQSQSDPDAWVSIEPPVGPAVAALVAPQPVELRASGDVLREDQDTPNIAVGDQLSAQQASEPSPPFAAENAWVVQLIGNASEASALASYRHMQDSYSGLLGSRQPLVSRSRVGMNGYWYRVRIAVNSRGDAQTLCGGLRAAGGSCLVQRG